MSRVFICSIFRPMDQLAERAARVQARRERRREALRLREIEGKSFKEIGQLLGDVSPQRAAEMVNQAKVERDAAG